jgi:nitroreductase
MIELIRLRRSIRKFKKNQIETEKIEILKEALLRSPTSRNRKSWEFILVRDTHLLKQLSRSKPSSADFLSDAPLGIVICGDEKKSDVWIEDCSIASIILQLTAQSLGLGSCWIQIRNRQYNDIKSSESYIQELLKIPENFRVESIIAVGYPGEQKQGIPENELDGIKIHENIFKTV